MTKYTPAQKRQMALDIRVLFEEARDSLAIAENYELSKVDHAMRDFAAEALRYSSNALELVHASRTMTALGYTTKLRSILRRSQEMLRRAELRKAEWAGGDA